MNFGLSGLFSFYTDRHDKYNRASEFWADASYSTEKQVNLMLSTDLWTPENRYHYVADVQYRHFLFNFYGIGNETREIDKNLTTQKSQHISVEVERKFSNLYTGLSTGFSKYSFNSEKSIDGLGNTGDQAYDDNALFICLSESIDTRDSHTYCTKGTYVKIKYLYYPKYFSRSNFEGSLIKFDFRSFKSLNSKLVLGFHTNYQRMEGSHLPFYLLPQLGNRTIMRGYYTGRYRDQNLLAAQAELRYQFSARLGFIGFVGAGNVYGNKPFQLNETKPSFGGGFRYFFDIERGLSISVDYGIGEKKPNEQRQTGLYIATGQSF